MSGRSRASLAFLALPIVALVLALVLRTELSTAAGAISVSLPIIVKGYVPPQPTTTPTPTPPPPSATDWPQVQKDPQHSGLSTETVGTNFRVKWTYPFQPERVHPQVQAIVYNGKVFVGTEMGSLYAIDASTGAKLWGFRAGGAIMNSAAADSGRVFFSSLDGAVYALSTFNGSQVWKQQLSTRLGFSTAPIVADGKVMLGGQDGYFYALDPASGTVVWKYKVGAPLLQTAAFDKGRVFFGAMDLRVYALDTAGGSLAWQSQRLSGTAFKDYWPVVYQDRVFVIPMADRSDPGITPGSPFYWFTDYSWLNVNGPAVAAGNLAQVADAMNAQDTAMSRYQANPGSYTKNLFVLDAATGQESMVVPHWTVQTNSGASTPPCVDRDGKLIVPVLFVRSAWGRLDLARARITDILYDGYNYNGQPVGSGQNPAGMGNTDEALSVSCSANLVFAMHEMEANANYTGAFDLNSRRWKQIGPGYRNQQMSSNAQGGGTNPASISNGMLYHISWHELIARTTQ